MSIVLLVLKTTRTHSHPDTHTQGGFTVMSIVLLVLSCVWGTGISFLGFLCLENIR